MVTISFLSLVSSHVTDLMYLRECQTQFIAILSLNSFLTQTLYLSSLSGIPMIWGHDGDLARLVIVVNFQAGCLASCTGSRSLR